MTDNELILELYRCMTPAQRALFKAQLIRLVETEEIEHTAPTAASSFVIV